MEEKINDNCLTKRNGLKLISLAELLEFFSNPG